MKFIRNLIPDWKNALLALLGSFLLVLSFPDFEYWFLAWFALVPFIWAIERQSHCVAACFSLGWIFGTAYFFGTCWWLTYAPIHYAGVPWPIAYILILIATLGAGIFPAVFATVLAVFIRRFGKRALFFTPFAWIFSEFARYWLTGNNWNAVGYSQAGVHTVLQLASVGGENLVSFFVAALNIIALFLCKIAVQVTRLGAQVLRADARGSGPTPGSFPFDDDEFRSNITSFLNSVIVTIVIGVFLISFAGGSVGYASPAAMVVGVQPNVPMSGLSSARLEELRDEQVSLAETALAAARTNGARVPAVVVLPESPMNYMYTDDREFQKFIGDFARRNNASVLFNSAEPDTTNGKYFNSAVMVGPDGRKIDEYDKIYLLPFGEAVPPLLEGIVPGFVGNFSYGREYDLLPVGDAKAGVMICFESHFGQLSREYVKNGADVIIEMTNDGYLGPTPVLRQHLANAVFRAIETNRPVLRVTNVGVTAYITENGRVVDPAASYQEATRVWPVSKSDGSRTFYVKYGDWFAWLSTAVTIILFSIAGFRKRRPI